MFPRGLRIFLVFLFFGEILSHNVAVEFGTKAGDEPPKHNGSKRKLSHMDLLIENLKYQKWEPDERICVKKILNIMNNVKNSKLWATWIWDAMQSPVGLLFGSKYQFGHFDQCMSAPWLETHPEYRTQYCLADVNLSNEEIKYTYADPESNVKNHINSISKYGVTFNQLTLGVCVPAECEAKSVTKFVKILYEDSHLIHALPDVEVAVHSCQVAGHHVEYTTKYYIVIAFLIFFMAAAVLSTILNNGKKNTFGSKLLNAFCIVTNTSHLSKTSEGDIKVMHGMRSITAGIVVGLHVLFVTNWISTGNPLQFEKDLDKYKLTALFHLELVVDTFFMMSGLLLIKGLLASKTVNLFVLIAKRYLRLVWMVSLFLMVSLHVAIYFGDGPLWPSLTDKETTICNKNWWPNFLMLGNYIDTTNMCYPVLWSVPADFHLSSVGIIIYWIFTKNQRFGMLTFGILFITSLIMPGVVTYQRELSGAPTFDLHSMANYRSVILTNPTYIWTHLRAGPFFVGIMAGYILFFYKPLKHRRIISKLSSYIGFFIVLSIALLMSVIGGSFHDKSKPYNVWEAAVFASLNRSIWAIAMACIIMLCEYGTIPFVESLLSWHPWVPLSKLSYGVYLLHTLVFSPVVACMRFPFKHDFYSFFIYTAGVIVLSNVLSYMLHIFFEAPMSRILNILISIKTEKVHLIEEKRNGVAKKTD